MRFFFVYAVIIAVLAMPLAAQWFIGMPLELKSSWMEGKRVVDYNGDTCHCHFFDGATSNGSVQNHNLMIGYRAGETALLSMQIGYYHPGTMIATAPGSKLASLVDSAGKKIIVYTITGNRQEYSLHYLSIEAAAGLRLYKGIHILAGISCHVSLASRLQKKFLLLEPKSAVFQPRPGVKYEDNLRTMVVDIQDPIRGLQNRWGIIGGLSYVLQLNTRLSIAPSLRYDYALNPFYENGTQYLHIFRSGVDMWMNL